MATGNAQHSCIPIKPGNEKPQLFLSSHRGTLFFSPCPVISRAEPLRLQIGLKSGFFPSRLAAWGRGLSLDSAYGAVIKKRAYLLGFCTA